MVRAEVATRQRAGWRVRSGRRPPGDRARRRRSAICRPTVRTSIPLRADGACASGGRCGSRCWVVGVTAGQPSDSPCTRAVGEASKVVLRSDCFDGPRAVADVAHSRGCPRSPRPQKPEQPVKPPQRPKPGCVTVCRHHRSPSAPGSQWKHCQATTRSLCRRSHHPTLLPLHVPPRQATSTSLARSASTS